MSNPSDNANSIRVLLVDDDQINRVVTGKLLRHAGYTVESAAGGAQALEFLETTPVDIVLMDVSMPGMDGLETTRRLRKLPSDVSRVPVVALTAFESEAERRRCLEAGMNEFITKPIELTAVAQIVERLTAPRE